MSSVNFLEKLLDGVSVEWKALKDLTLPTKNIKWRETKRTYRYIDLTSVSIETKAITETIEISSADAPSRAQKIVEENDVIFATTRPTQKRYCLIGDQYSGEIASTGYCVLRAKQKEVLPKWVWHWIASSKFNKYVEENQSGSAYPAISDAKVKEFRIPIPCPDNPKKSLEIQAEIVRILDTMTAHTAELTAELTARKKQYNYYRDKLLSFEDGNVEWKSLGEVYKFQYGKGNTIPTVGGDYPVYGSNGIVGSHNEYNSEDSPVIGHIGAYAGIVNWGKGKHFVTYNGVICKLINNCIHPKYAYHQLLKQDFNSMAKSASHPFISYETLNKVIIPVPSYEEQTRIVEILDKFEKITESITEGLPCEIELRQKQYAYYRDLLLSFPQAQTA